MRLPRPSMATCQNGSVLASQRYLIRKSWRRHKKMGWRAIPWPLWPLVVYLAAVLIVGKGPTYLRIGPVYWGEAVLALAVIWAAYSALHWTPCKRGMTGLSVAIGLFMALGALLTFRSLAFWPVLDVLRDAATWYYSVFYFIGLAVAQQFDYGDRFWRLLCGLWLMALVWGTGNWLSGERLSALGPLTPGRGWPVLSNSGSELYQNVGMGAFVLLAGVWRSRFVPARVLRVAAVLGLVCTVVAPGRGVRLGLAAAVVAAMTLSFGRGHRSALQKRLAAVALAVVLASAVLGVTYGAQFAHNTHLDRFSSQAAPDAGDNLTWRWVWWQRLAEEVLVADPFLGLGFGRTLDVYNVFITGDDFNWPVRSPHNFNMTILSRMGLLGLAIWGAILVLGLGSLMARAWRNGVLRNTYSREQRTEIVILLMMLIASYVNASFGVLLEGPVLAIPFWFVLGFATVRSLRGNSPALRAGEVAYRGTRIWFRSPS